MKQQKLVWISAITLLICVASAILAVNIQVADVDGQPDWDSFGKAIWITVLVTIPSFSIFLITAIATVVKTRKK